MFTTIGFGFHPIILELDHALPEINDMSQIVALIHIHPPADLDLTVSVKS